MNEIVTATLAYFRPPKDYFWRWADNGEVIEWRNGTTICYRDELMLVLSGLTSQDESIPSLGTVLLTLAACQDNYNWQGKNHELEILKSIVTQLPGATSDTTKKELIRLLQVIVQLMDLIHELPHELKSGSGKVHLIQEIFSQSNNPVSPDQARIIIGEFGSGRLDGLVLTGIEVTTRQLLEADLSRFILALNGFRDKNQLELKLRTGLEQLPQPVPTELPLPKPPDLLEQLAEDPQTAGIARIAQRLVAALNIPMHTQGAGNQPFGGISDITNRGNYDRLLLSELANDDLLLTARLVNQEALYLRREEPPVHLDRERTILLDTTLRMWGLPRVFAIAAALACARNKKHVAAVNTYALGGNNYQEMDLASREGVIRTLERLDAAQHCGKALSQFLSDQPSRAPTDCVLITSEELMQGSLQTSLSEVKQSLRFLITVNRNGQLQFYEFVSGSRKLLNTVRLDLDELLTAAPKVPRLVRADDRLPAFLNYEPAPLYFPTTGMRLSDKTTYSDKELGIIGVTETQRILYWPGKDTGAIELHQFIERGNYSFGSDGKSMFFILVSDPNKTFVKLYKLGTQEYQAEITDLSTEINEVKEVIFQFGHFYIKPTTGYISVEGMTGKLVNRYSAKVSEVFQQYNRQPLDFHQIKRHINNGYTVVHRIKQLYVNQFGELTLDYHRVELLNNSVLKLSEDRKQMGGIKYATVESEVNDILPNPKVRFRRLDWADGSLAVVDSRGLLHLRSADATIPEITLVLVIGKATAGWASDGSVSGPFYFTGVAPSKSMTPAVFYKKYIQRFIDQLP